MRISLIPVPGYVNVLRQALTLPAQAEQPMDAEFVVSWHSHLEEALRNAQVDYRFDFHMRARLSFDFWCRRRIFLITLFQEN